MMRTNADLFWPSVTSLAGWLYWLITPGLPAIFGILFFSIYASWVFTDLWYQEWRIRKIEVSPIRYPEDRGLHHANQWMHDVYAAMSIFAASNAIGAAMVLWNPLWMYTGNVDLVFIGNLCFAIMIFALERRRAVKGTHQFNMAGKLSRLAHRRTI